jgi:alpha-glucosidase
VGAERVWWKDGVHYQIYLRSYADANGDGVGDLRGVIEHLDHLARLGVDGVWLSPITVSPDADWGYDVSDYAAVQPALGTLADVDELIAEGEARRLKIILDLVPNHTSIEHAWFSESRSSRDNPKRDWYVWADPQPDGSPPNNWVSSFGGPAWTLDEATGQYYLHNFTAGQPDLNWWNDGVRDEFDRILRFWFDRGVAGFRIDVAHMIVKDRELRDNPPTTDADHWLDQLRGQRPVYNQCRPEVHEVLRRWRALADAYDPPRVLIGETYVFDVPTMASFYGAGDELHLAFNIPLLHTSFEAAALCRVVEETEAEIPSGSWPVWTAGNHDVSRFPTRWGDGDPDRARCALMMTLTLRGAAFLYYGDELGLPDTDVPRERLLDPVGLRFHPYAGRDPARTPMPWTAAQDGGFSALPGIEPWLPYGDTAATNVEDQRRDPDSMLNLCRDLIGLRDALPDLLAGAYATLRADDGVWAWRRGERVVVALNLADDEARVDDVNGIVRIATRRARDGERVSGTLTLGPWEGVVVWLDGEPRPALM